MYLFLIKEKLDAILCFHSLLLCLPKEINLNSIAKKIQVGLSVWYLVIQCLGNVMLCPLFEIELFFLPNIQDIISSYKAIPMSEWIFVCWKWPDFKSGNNYSRNWHFLIGFYDSEQQFMPYKQNCFQPKSMCIRFLEWWSQNGKWK